MDTKPHVLIFPFPLQGHVMPLMKLAYQLAENGVKVKFVNTDFIQAQIMAATPLKLEDQNLIKFVSISDGLESINDRMDPFKNRKSILEILPTNLRNLIQKINQSEDDDHITCVIADISAWWALQVAQKLGIKCASFSPAGLGNLALVLQIPHLVEAGIIDVNGTPIREEIISLSKEIPAWNPNELTWSCPGQPGLQKYIYEILCAQVNQSFKIANWHISNSFIELEQSACELVQNILPIGPLTITSHLPHFPGSFRPEDTTCVNWLDNQPRGSVIYIAFGSTTLLTRKQFEELAFGLELLGQPFLWVLRSDMLKANSVKFPDGYKERIAKLGKFVEWTPQEKILSHPSIACFLSHCGWNSIMEGIFNGIPFLCWPYFADQFHNQRYICESWKIGLRLNFDEEEGIISRQEIETKTKLLMADHDIKGNAVRLKEVARKSIAEGGSSFNNFQIFLQELKN